MYINFFKKFQNVLRIQYSIIDHLVSRALDIILNIENLRGYVSFPLQMRDSHFMDNLKLSS